MDGHISTGIDIKLSEDFDGERIINDDGIHLDGGMPDDKM